MLFLEYKTYVLQADPRGEACSLGLFLVVIENETCLHRRLLDTRFFMGTSASEILSLPQGNIPDELEQEWIEQLGEELQQLSGQIGFDHKLKRIR
ncbi:MAG: hypothetical protein MUF42_12210 [Cytophagaceae bacterium]|jgi:hypothetical protein|nr:hypothetical protein [Cytophagaceae bacterium]